MVEKTTVSSTPICRWSSLRVQWTIYEVQAEEKSFHDFQLQLKGGQEEHLGNVWESYF